MIKKLLFLLGWWWLAVSPVMAMPTCTAVVAPGDVSPTAETPLFSYELTNTGDGAVRWIRVESPLVELQPWTVNLGGWDVSSTGTTTIIKFGTLAPATTLSFSIETIASLASLSGFSGNWTIAMSENTDGSDAGTCTGSLGLLVNPNAQESTPPVISNVSISELTGSSATVNWTTDESASSRINYDVAPDADPHAFTSGSDTLAVNHSLTLTASIAPTTTYYFQICGTDVWGNQGCTEELTFTTGAYNAPATQVVVETVTQTTTQTNTVVRLLVDATPPVVTLTNNWREYYNKGPTITGTARDNKMIVAVDYSIDKGKTWRPVEIENRKSSVSFTIDLPIEEEGNYDFQVRAYDAEGNKGVSKTQTIVIDRLPPLFGATYLSWGSGLSVPTTQERMVTMVGLPLSLMLSAVGGPTEIRVEGTGNSTQLVKDGVSGRWFGKLKFVVPGETTVMATGIDGLGRTTTSALFQVTVLPAGTIVNEANEPLLAEITVMARNAITGVFAPWDGAPFGRSNPTKTNEQGEFGLVLPPGTYYLKVESGGYRGQTSDIFSLTHTGLVRAEMKLKPRSVMSIGQWKIGLPNLMRESFKVEVAEQIVWQSGTKVVSQLLQTKLAEMEFKSEEGDPVTPVDWLGQTTVLLLDAPWLPSIGESIGSLQKLAMDVPKVRTVWVASQHGASALQGIRARTGGIVSAMVADDEALLTEYLGIHQLPVSMVIDRLGIVRGIYRGIVPVEVVKQVMEE